MYLFTYFPVYLFLSCLPAMVNKDVQNHVNFTAGVNQITFRFASSYFIVVNLLVLHFVCLFLCVYYFRSCERERLKINGNRRL